MRKMIENPNEPKLLQNLDSPTVANVVNAHNTSFYHLRNYLKSLAANPFLKL